MPRNTPLHDLFWIHFQRFRYLQRKIYTNSSSVVLSEEVVHISKNKTVNTPLEIRNKIEMLCIVGIVWDLPFYQRGFTTAKLTNYKYL